MIFFVGLFLFCAAAAVAGAMGEEAPEPIQLAGAAGIALGLVLMLVGAGMAAYGWLN